MIDKIPIFPYCAYQVWEYPIGATENGRKRSFVQKNPIFSEFSL